MPRFRPRISLLTVLLLTTIAGMALVIVQLWREVGPLRKEVHKLRQFVGELSIDDHTRIHAIEVRQPNPNLWRWRLFLPPGAQYKLVEFGGPLPPRGKLSNKHWLAALRNASIGSSEYLNEQFQGEFTLDVSLAPVEGGWRFQIFGLGSDAQSHYTFADNWPGRMGRSERSDIWPAQQRVFPPGEPILLLHLSKRIRKSARGIGTEPQAPSELVEGIALWLEPPGIAK
jgi:hypothetical protein